MSSAWRDEDLNMALPEPVTQNLPSQQQQLSHGSRELVPLILCSKAAARREGGCQRRPFRCLCPSLPSLQEISQTSGETSSIVISCVLKFSFSQRNLV